MLRGEAAVSVTSESSVRAERIFGCRLSVVMVPERKQRQRVTHRQQDHREVMASSESDVIDFASLERELQVALASEHRHQRENEAKLRAVSQRVTSYKEFRDLVLSCHLKPLEREDKDRGPRKQPWNSVAHGNKK